MNLSQFTLQPADNSRRLLDTYTLWLRDSAVVFAFISVTIAFATTTSGARELIEIGRNLSASCLFLVIGVLAFRDQRIQRSTLIGLAAYLFFVCYGITLAVFKGGLVFIVETMFRDILLTIALIYIFSKGTGDIVSEKAAQLMIAFGFLIVGITIYYNGLDLSYPPRFSFEYSSISREGVTVYSQGVSKFYGLFAVISAYLSVNTKNFYHATLYALAMVFFLFLSALGGARGDAVSALFLALGYFFLKGRNSLRLLFLAVIFIILLFLAARLNFDDFILISRLQNLNNGFGAREYLFLQAADLISSQWDCLYFGCGFGYFQKYYGLSAGYYPHNFFLELIIVYGLPLSLFLAFFTIYGIVLDKSESSVKNTLFYLITLLFLLIQLKSGTLLAAWWLIASISFLAAKSLIGMSRSLNLRPYYKDRSR